jgi:glycosyltransferase involved in cell wall biosynthesis
MPPRFLAPRARRTLARLVRRLTGVERRVVSLPAATAAPVGRVLLSYVVDPFLVANETAISHAHTQDWECWAMAATWRELGFAVDVVHWTHAAFVPTRSYDLLIDPRLNLERLAPLVGPACLKILHAETAHWATSDREQLRRLDQLARRRGRRLTRTRLVGENRGIETCDCAVVLGNEWTLATYRPFGKPLYRVPISNAFDYPAPERKEFDAVRGRFLWFGGVGFVHKGLDLALEALAGADGLHLDVAAPIDREPDFVALYERELLRTPNVRALGWLDVGSPRFLEVADANLAIVFPSCSEGGGGSVVTAMHAGLVPVATAAASVDFGPGEGVEIGEATVEGVRAACRALAAQPAGELRALATAAWRRARSTHSRAHFRANYRAAALAILERFRPALRARIAA